MAAKVFLERGEFKLVGDERDVMVPHHLQPKVMIWCRDNGVAAGLNYRGSQTRWLIQQAFNMDLWSILDEKQRTMFILRWSCPA